MMKKLTKFLCFLIAVFSFLMPYQKVCSTDIQQDSPSGNAEKKIYSKATISDDFADNRILVVMNSKTSRKLADYSLENFSELKCTKIKDLTTQTKAILKKGKASSNIDNTTEKVLSDTISSTQTSLDTFKQILCIELEQCGKENVLKAIQILEKREDILYAGPDYQIQCESLTPNDTYCSDQWAIDKINLPEAWDITTGVKEVVVGVIDSGIDGSHPDLANRIKTDLCRDFTSGAEVAVGTPSDPQGHGTHVAGIIGAQGNNGIGTCGVCWNISLASLRVLDEIGQGYASNVALAIDYAITQNIPILNLSARWYASNTERYNYPLQVAISNYPGLFVCAAGNEDENNDAVDVYPTNINLPNLISVAATDITDSLCSFSNYGKTTVHLAAPGEHIKSTYPTNLYLFDSGTSMAAPYVAGVAALIKSLNRELTAPEIKALILNNVDKVDALSDKCITGGRLNAYKAVRAATEPQTFTGDVNGDGKADLILSRAIGGKRALTVCLGQSNGKFSEPVTTTSTRNFYYHDPAFVGDFNGDGRTDLVIMWTNGVYRQLLVYTGKADGTFTEGQNLNSSQKHSLTQWPSKFFVADVNGDGKDDFVVQYRNTNGKRCILVYKGTSASPYLEDAVANAIQSIYDYKYNSNILMGDVNGDGRADMVVHFPSDDEIPKRRFLVYLGKSDGTFYEGALLTTNQPYLPDNYPNKIFISDVNGDGKDDIVLHFGNSNGKRCNLVYKGKAASPYLIDTTTNALTSNNNYVETDPVFVGDINGDGCSDMVIMYASSGKRRLLTYTADTNGTYPHTYRSVSTHSHDVVKYPCGAYIADVNGDGRDDLIIKWKNSGNNISLLTYLGTTTGTFNEAVATAPSTSVPYYIAA